MRSIDRTWVVACVTFVLCIAALPHARQTLTPPTVSLAPRAGGSGLSSGGTPPTIFKPPPPPNPRGAPS